MSQLAETTGSTSLTAEEEKLWGMLAHLLSLLGYSLVLGQFVAPGVVYWVYKDRSDFVAFHAWQSLCWQVALTAAGLILWVVGIPLLFIIPIGGLVMMIIAAHKAYHGEWYEYPLVGSWARRHSGTNTSAA